MDAQQMSEQIAAGDGFLAALDQSGGSTPKALAAYGVDESAWSSDDEMFALIHKMRCRVIEAPAFSSGKIIGTILFEMTMDGQVDGRPVPDVLHEKGVVPFIKIDKGLLGPERGVQLMKPMPDLDDLLSRSKQLGMFGTKERSVIHAANADGVKAIVEQQFEVARQVLGHDLVPIIEPEVDITSSDREACDDLLVNELQQQLDRHNGNPVMLKLSLPVKPGHYDSLVAHPKVLKVVALSGGYERTEACEELAKNPGVIASFSRALLNDLRADMTDEEFDAALAEAVDEIYQASTQKTS